MSAIGAFFKRLFTDHLGTKFLAFMLAVLLYFFVDESLTSSRLLEGVRLEITLDEEVAAERVLLGRRIELGELEIEGKSKSVDDAAERLGRATNLVRIEINRAFLDAYTGATEIPIDEAFCEKHIFPQPEVRLAAPPRGQLMKIRLPVKRDDLEVRLELAPNQERHLSLGLDHPYQGTLDGGQRIDASFSEEGVRLSGPADAFTTTISDRKQLLVYIPDIPSLLRVGPAPDGPRSDPVDGIAWTESGIPEDLRGYVRVHLHDGRTMTTKDFVNSLRVRYVVEERWETRQIDNLEIREIWPPGLHTLDAAFRGAEGLRQFTEAWLQQGRCDRFWIRAPKTIWDDAGALADLVLILDYANREVVASGETILVPVRLSVRDPRQLERLDILRQVRIAGSDESADQEPRLRFDKSG